MGVKHLIVKNTGLILVLFLSWTGVHGQVVIKDKVEIQPQSQVSPPPGIQGAIAGPGEFYHPVLRRIVDGQYLVMKSGILKFYFNRASSYGIANIEDHVFHYSIYGPATDRTDSVEISDFLPNPVVLSEGADPACPQTQTYFDSSILYGVGPTDDTWILHSHPNQTPNSNNYGDEPKILTAGHFNSQYHPDSASGTAYLQFGIHQLETNANLDAAYLGLTAVPTSTSPASSTNPNGNLRLYKAAGPWNEQTLTFANRPSTELTNFITVTPNDMEEIEGVGYDYTKNITSFVDGWLNNEVPDHGMRISSDSGHVFVSKESPFEAASQSSITLHLSVPETPYDPVLSLGEVEAGDTLAVDYMGLDVALNPIFTANPVEADEALSFGASTGCQVDNSLGLLPFMQEDTTRKPYFEFVLNRGLTIFRAGYHGFLLR